MAVTQTTSLSNSLRIQYLNDYMAGALRRRFYDFAAAPVSELSGAAGAAQSMADLNRGGTVRVTFIGDMGLSTTPMSQVQDIVPQILPDAYADVTVDMFGDAIQTSQKALIQYFPNYRERSPEKVGLNMMEMVDYKAMEAALGGSLVDRYVARASLDAGTTAHRASDTNFSGIAARLSQFNCPGWEGEGKPTSWAGFMDHFVLTDIASGGNVVNVAQYQDGNMVLNNEVGRLHNFRLVASGYAKVFLGAGIDNGTAISTTLSSAATALATTIVVASGTNIAAGMWLNIWNAEETASTFYPDNERVKVASVSGTTITIVGGAENGGLRWPHASGKTVGNADSVHPVLFAGPRSLAKVYAPEIGEFGELVGPLQQGLAKQWTSFAWKWYGGYNRLSENWLYRGEYSVSEEA